MTNPPSPNPDDISSLSDALQPPSHGALPTGEPLAQVLSGPSEYHSQLPGPGFLGAVGWIVVYIVVQVVCVFPIILIKALQHPSGLNGVMSEMKEDATLVDLLLVLSFVAAVGIGLLFRSRRALGIRGIPAGHAAIIVLLILPLLLVNLQLASWIGKVTRTGTPPEGPGAYKQLAEQALITVLFLGGFLAAAGEELFFRGFIGRGLVARYGVGLGVFLTALLFGVMHCDSREHVVGTMLLGIGVQSVFLITKTLAAPVLLHMLNNGVAFGLMKLASQLDHADLLGLSEDEFPLPLVVSALVAVLALFVLLYRTRTQWVLRDGGVWSPGYMTAEMPPAHLEAQAQRRTAGRYTILAAVAGWCMFAGVASWYVLNA
jgi:membrane protease YdiL (CAAX protease family)